MKTSIVLANVLQMLTQKLNLLTSFEKSIYFNIHHVDFILHHVKKLKWKTGSFIF